MKKKYAILLTAAMLWFLLWVQILGAAWNKDVPAATLGLNVSNPLILANFSALETAIGANHEFSTGGTNSGKHTTIVMEEQSSVTTSTNEMGFYCKDLGTAPGIYVRPQSNGTAIQWSDISGNIVAAALGADIIDETKIADDGIDSEHYNDGSIDTVHIANNQITAALIEDDITFDQFPSTPSTAPDANYEVANKKFVDDSVSSGDQRLKGWVKFNATDAGSAAISDHYNVSGVVRNGVGDFTVSWDTNFGNADYCIITTVYHDAARIVWVKGQAAGTTRVQISQINGDAGQGQLCYVAVMGDQ